MHSHVIVAVLDAANAAGLAKVDPHSWQILSYSDSAALGMPPSFSFTLPGRAARLKDGTTRPWRELLSPGDLVQAAGWNWDGKKDAPARTMADGFIKRVSTRETLTPNGYDYTTDVQCAGYQDLLMQDSVAWWMYYGSTEGWAKARAQMLPDDMSGRVDKILANYLSKVVFHHASWERQGRGLGARLGYHLRSLPPSAPLNTNLAIAEGTHWSIMGELLDAPLHEMFSVIQPGNYKPQGGYAHRPDAPQDKPLIGRIAGDGGRTWLMMRPTPHPYADKTGKANVSEWKALTLREYDAPLRPLADGGQSLGFSDDAVKNFFMVYPSYQMLDETMTFTAGIAVKNEASIKRYGYRPYKLRTHLVLGSATESNAIELAKELTWRLAGQMNAQDRAFDGSIVTDFDPTMQVGYRVRLSSPMSDLTKEGAFEGYASSVSRQWTPEDGGTTSVTLTQIRPAAHYDTGAKLVEGLSRVQVDALDTAPSASPEKKKNAK